MDRVTADLVERIEFIYVNDESQDDSLDLLQQLTEWDARITVIDLSRNHGHQLAVTAGLDFARGDAVVIIDSDLQDPPEIALELINWWREGYDVVYAQRWSRDDTVFKRATADAFYRLLSALSDIDIPRNVGDSRLISRKVLDAHPPIPRARPLPPRRGGSRRVQTDRGAVRPTRPPRRGDRVRPPQDAAARSRRDHGLQQSTADPHQPHGGLVAGVALIGVVYVLVVRVFFPEQTVAGWAFTVIAILFIGGLNLVMMGIIGSYLGRIYTEVKSRPLYGVQEVYHGPGPDG